MVKVSPSLIRQLHSRGLFYGPPVFIRIFKSERELEVWGESDAGYDLFQTYAVEGTTYLLLSLEELIEKLAALMPPPWLNLVRCHGVLPPHAADRSRIVPGTVVKTGEPEHWSGHACAGDRPSGRQRLSWAQLLARVFSYRCESLPDCGGRMRELVAILCGLQQCPGKALHHVKMRTNRGRA